MLHADRPFVYTAPNAPSLQSFPGCLQQSLAGLETEAKQTLVLSNEPDMLKLAKVRRRGGEIVEGGVE